MHRVSTSDGSKSVSAVMFFHAKHEPTAVVTYVCRRPRDKRTNKTGTGFRDIVYDCSREKQIVLAVRRSRVNSLVRLIPIDFLFATNGYGNSGEHDNFRSGDLHNNAYI